MLISNKTLFENRNLSFQNKIALEEGFYILFTKIIFESNEFPQDLTLFSLFEYSRCIIFYQNYMLFSLK